jgi:hypothetical protein
MLLPHAKDAAVLRHIIFSSPGTRLGEELVLLAAAPIFLTLPLFDQIQLAFTHLKYVPKGGT